MKDNEKNKEQNTLLFPSSSSIEISNQMNNNSQKRQQQNLSSGITWVISEQFGEAAKVEMHYQEILSILNRIADNREVNMVVSFAVILILALFLGYMTIYF